MRGSDDPQASGEGASTGRVVPPLSDGPHYNPHQPRVPKGYAHGGRWTRVGGPEGAPAQGKVIRDETGQEPWEKYFESYHPDGSVKERMVVNRDGSTIHSEYTAADSITRWDDKHRVTTRDGKSFIFENDGKVQTIYDENDEVLSKTEWTREGPVPVATVQQAFSPRDIVTQIAKRSWLFVAGMILKEWLSATKDPNQIPAYAFRAKAYERVPEKNNQLIFVANLTEKEVDEICQHREAAQDSLDSAVQNIKREDYRNNDGAYGTAVHMEFARLMKQYRLMNPDKNDIKLEASYIKTFVETGEKRTANSIEAAYATKGSVRYDAFEPTKSGAACTYDPKSGKRGLRTRDFRRQADHVPFDEVFETPDGPMTRPEELERNSEKALGRKFTIVVMELRPRPRRPPQTTSP